MFKAKYYRLFAHILFALTGSLAAASVWAGLRVPPELHGFPWLQIAVAGVITLWGGVGRTAVRAVEDAQQRRDSPGVPTGFNLKSELLKDLYSSSGLGFFVYLVGASQGLEPWLLGPALWLSGYLGTKPVLDFIVKLSSKGKI